MKKLVVLLLVAAVLLGTAMVVFSDQNGTKSWCNIDEYGCWVSDTDNDGNATQSYIYFWSESARQYIMGGQSSAGSNVVPAPGTGAEMDMVVPVVPAVASSASSN